MNIELKGFNGHGHLVCDSCPADHGGDLWGCYFGYPRVAGKLNVKTGKTGEDGCSVTLRPQVCIDNHGR